MSNMMPQKGERSFGCLKGHMRVQVFPMALIRKMKWIDPSQSTSRVRIYARYPDPGFSRKPLGTKAKFQACPFRNPFQDLTTKT
jgi:hypothetical protein